MSDLSQTPVDGSKRNRAYLLWSGISESVSDILASPGMVLPFLYLALGAPQYIATLLLPCVKAARLIVEALISPYVKVGARAKQGNRVKNELTAKTPDFLFLRARITDLGSMPALEMHPLRVIFDCFHCKHRNIAPEIRSPDYPDAQNMRCWCQI